MNGRRTFGEWVPGRTKTLPEGAARSPHDTLGERGIEPYWTGGAGGAGGAGGTSAALVASPWTASSSISAS